MFEAWLLMALVIGFLLLSSIVLSWSNFFTLRKLKRTVSELEALKQRLANSSIPTQDLPDSQQIQEASEIAEEVTSTPESITSDLDANFPEETEAAAPLATKQADPNPWGEKSDKPKTLSEATANTHKAASDTQASTIQPSWKSNWMVWLGGGCIALSGIFLARYSIEQGLLGPTARIVLGLLLGLGMLLGAEWLRRKMETAYSAVAALAGGAIVMLYSVTLAALHLYQLWPPLFVFALLALISLAAMVLAVWHGPILAWIGIAGAYAVPLLIGGSSSDLLPLLIYVLIVTSSSLVLQRYVQQNWLFNLTLTGVLGWWWLLQLSGQSLEWVGLYLSVSAYLFLTIPQFNFKLTQSYIDQPIKRSIKAFFSYKQSDQRQTLIALSLIILAQGISIALHPDWQAAIWLWTPLLVLILFSSRFNERLKLLPWLSALVFFSSLIAAHFHTGWTFSSRFIVLNLEDQTALLKLLVVWTLLYVGHAYWSLKTPRYPALKLSLGIMAPLFALALAWQLAGDLLQDWFWSAAALICGLGYIGRAQIRQTKDRSRSWLILAGHLGYSLAVVIFFDSATLILALAAQIVSLAWLHQQHEDALLSWVMKLLLMLILARLTLQPWLLPQYETSLLSYAGCFALVFTASRLNKTHAISRWLEGASLHLLVLLLFMLLRFWLYDGDLFIRRYSFTEAAFNTLIWGGLGLVYYYRSFLAEQMQSLYRLTAQLLLVASVINYLVLISWLNPLFNWSLSVAETPIFNLLLLAYGAPILLFILAARFYDSQYKAIFWSLAGIAGWIFVNLEIRHLWQGDLTLVDPMLSGELYSYSLAWLLMAAGAILLGSLRQQLRLYQAGMVLLLLTIAKIFLIDMSDLTGLLRVASFMGLGLCLLGLAFTHQWLSKRGTTSSSPSSD